MERVEFTLSMPGCPSWDGRWSGEGKHYAIVKRLPRKVADQLDRKSWSHSWPDGWCALVKARVVPVGERVRKSDGFNGYDWMVSNILTYGTTRVPTEGAPRIEVRPQSEPLTPPTKEG